MDLDEIVMTRPKRKDYSSSESILLGFPFVGVRFEKQRNMIKPEEALAQVRKHVGPGLPVSTYKVLTAAGAYAFCKDNPDNEELKSLLEEYIVYLKPKKIEDNSWRTLIENIAELNSESVIRLVKKGLSDDQKKALHKIIVWLESPWNADGAFFILRGYAGSGKTTVCKRVLLYLSLMHPKMQYRFTAPTNKATKVLRSMVDKDAVTIYSALKLSMTEDEDRQKITAADTANITIPVESLLGIDEASMLNAMLVDRVKSVALDRNLKVLIVGDPAQLRPVNEESSLAWDLTEDPRNRSMLTEVMRFDNQILSMSKRIRSAVKVAASQGTIRHQDLFQDDNDEMDEGVFQVTSSALFEKKIRAIAEKQGPKGFQNVRVMAWRNKTVEKYNDIIRESLGFIEEYNVGELIMLGSPLVTEVNGHRNIIASIDDEFDIAKVESKVADQTEPELYDVYALNPSLYLLPVKYFELGTTAGITIRVTAKEDCDMDDNLNKLRLQAYKSPPGERKKAWGLYWKLRYFTTHVRRAAAMTVHRSQGSGYETVFVDTRDIFSNPDREERMQLAYVAATRAMKSIYYL